VVLASSAPPILRDLELCERYLVSRAELGKAQAQFLLGCLYRGHAPRKAIKWATYAAMQGHPLAIGLLDLLRDQLRPN
jgi:TPR repeat protein